MITTVALDAQIMLLSIILNIILLCFILLILFRDHDLPTYLFTIFLLGFGTMLGYLAAELYSVKAKALLLIYELLLPLAFWSHLTKFIHIDKVKWVPVPMMVIAGLIAYMYQYEFHSQAMLVYELVFLLGQVMVIAYLIYNDPFLCDEKLYLLASLITLLVYGPAYGLLWGELGVNTKFFSIVASFALTILLVGKGRNPTLDLAIGKVPEGVEQGSKRKFRPGQYLFDPDERKRILSSFLDDVVSGRNGLLMSMSPVPMVMVKLKKMNKDIGSANLSIAHLTHAPFSENALDPNDTRVFIRSVTEFIKRSKGGLILIQDLHYLVSNTNIWEVCEAIRYLQEIGSDLQYTLLLDKDLLADWEVDHLRKVKVKDI